MAYSGYDRRRVTWIGTVAGLLGLFATYRQARGARVAAAAASRAVDAFAERLALPDLSYAYAQLNLLPDLVHAGKVEQAQWIVGSLRRPIVQAFSYWESRGRLPDEIPAARRALQTVEDELELLARGSEDARQQKLRRAVRGLSEFLAAREAELKFPMDATRHER